MKFSTILSSFFFLYASAFPSYPGLEDRSGDLEKRKTPFDPVSQKIDVTGNHEFRPPGASDLRGPCPGLNALANHGYIQRSGVTSFIELLSATQMVYGLAFDLSLALSYATRFPCLFSGCSAH